MSNNNPQPSLADLQAQADSARNSSVIDTAFGGAKLGLVIGTMIGTGVILSGAAHALSRLVFGDR